MNDWSAPPSPPKIAGRGVLSSSSVVAPSSPSSSSSSSSWPQSTPTANLPKIPSKRYFSISEVSELCQVKPHVLRYWEQEFPKLKPNKRGNRRYYQYHEVVLVRRIRELLYEQLFTIKGARAVMDETSKTRMAPTMIDAMDWEAIDSDLGPPTDDELKANESQLAEPSTDWEHWDAEAPTRIRAHPADSALDEAPSLSPSEHLTDNLKAHLDPSKNAAQGALAQDMKSELFADNQPSTAPALPVTSLPTSPTTASIETARLTQIRAEMAEIMKLLAGMFTAR